MSLTTIHMFDTFFLFSFYIADISLYSECQTQMFEQIKLSLTPGLGSLPLHLSTLWAALYHINRNGFSFFEILYVIKEGSSNKKPSTEGL